ncbi:hypothetical protein ACFL1R_07325 [Candidatus Latescibacterota bacterium]
MHVEVTCGFWNRTGGDKPVFFIGRVACTQGIRKYFTFSFKSVEEPADTEI